MQQWRCDVIQYKATFKQQMCYLLRLYTWTKVNKWGWTCSQKYCLATSIKEMLLSTAEEVLQKQRKKIKALGHKWGSGSVWPETTEVNRHWSKARVQKSEQRRHEDDGSKGKVAWGMVQQYREEADGRTNNNNNEDFYSASTLMSTTCL